MPKGTCSLDDCGLSVYCRGWCQKHYCRWRSNGDPLITKRTASLWPEFERLLGLDTDECVLWPYSGTWGYGKVTSPVVGPNAVHILACEHHHGPRPDPLFQAAHRCGTRNCMNGRHLRWATRSENEMDKPLHGSDIRGERHPRHVLSADDVHEIRRLRATTNLTYRQIAERFSASVKTVNAAGSGDTWKWLNPLSTIT